MRAVAPGTESQQATRSVADFLPPYAVVSHNDDVNSMDHVVHALLASVPELTLERAIEVMMAAHTHGQARSSAARWSARSSIATGWSRIA